MKLSKKYKISIIGAMCGIGMLAPAITVPLMNNLNARISANNPANYYYTFNNRVFESLEDATNWTINDSKPVSSSLYVGDVMDAVFDQESKRVDTSKLRPYASDKLHPAFKDAIGQYTHDYKTAKNSFVNQGLIDYLYDDFNNNLHYSEDDAIKAMRDATFRTPIAYNEINLLDTPNSEFPINPLNKTDIEVFKNKIIENFNISNKLDIKAYDLIKDPTDPLNSHAYASLTTQYLNQNADYIDKFFNVVANKYIALKDDFFNTQVKWDVTVSTIDHLDSSYVFANVRDLGLQTNDRIFDKISSDGRSLSFNGVGKKNLAKFNSYFNRYNFDKDHLVSLHIGKSGFVVCEVASTANENLGVSYNLEFVGTDWGGSSWWGPDIRILEPGYEDFKELKFSVDFKMQENTKKTSDFEDILRENFTSQFIADNWVEPEYKKDADDNDIRVGKIDDLIYPSTFSYDLHKSIMEYTYKTIWGIEKNSLFNPYRPMIKYKGANIEDENFKNDFYMDTKARANENISGWNVIWKQRPENGLLGPEQIIKDGLLQYLTNLDFTNWSKTLKYYIEYNEYPLFEVPVNVFQKYFTKPGLLDEGVSKVLIKKNFDPLKATIDSKELASSLINISSRFNIHNTDKLNFNFLPYDINNKQYTYSKYEQDELGFFKYKDNSLILDINYKDLDYKMETAMLAYNKSLKNIKDNNANLSETTSGLMLKPDEVLTLYTKRGIGSKTYIPEKFYYSEYLTSATAFNDALLDKNNANLYNKEADILSAIEMNRILKPAKIVILYDLLGRPMNAGIRLSEEEKLLTTNDAVYDSRNTVLDNVLRTQIIRNDPAKVFYLENSGEYTLLRNVKDLIYKLKWEDKSFYFLSWKDSWNYLYELIKFSAVKSAR